MLAVRLDQRSMVAKVGLSGLSSYSKSGTNRLCGSGYLSRARIRGAPQLQPHIPTVFLGS